MPYTYNPTTGKLDYYSMPTFISGTITAHDELTGLLNDDHTQYHTDTRGDARYYTKTILNNGQLDNRYYTETEIDTISGSITDRDFIENIICVAKNGSDSNTGTSGDPFLTIEAAMNNVVSGTKTSISVYPGVYYENTINVKRKVSIIGTEGPEVTYVCTNSGTTTLFNFDGTYGRILNRIENIGLYDYDESNRATLINVEYHGTLSLRDLEFCGCKNCLVVNHSGAMVRITASNVDGDMSVPIEDAIKVTAGYVDVRAFYNVFGSRITNLFTCSGTNSELTVNNLTSRSPTSAAPIIENVFYISDGGKITCMDTILEECDNCVCIDNVGVGSTFYGRTVQANPKKKAICNTSATANINLIAIDIEREQLDSVCAIKAIGWDSTGEKFKMLGNTAIGINGCGSSLQVGEGGSYKHDVKTVTYSGTIYTEIPNGNDISFPSTSSGTCIYFGDSNNYRFYGLRYTMGNTSINLGTGAIAWEYYDITNGWQEFNTLNTTNTYSNTTANVSFGGNENIAYSVRFDQNIKTGIKENNTTNSGITPATISGVGEGMYVRCRITSDITTSPVFKNVRLKPNFINIRPNGTHAYHGDARAIHNVALPFGDSGSGGTSKTLGVSSNINYPYWNNGLVDGSTQSLYFRCVISESVDTSCGLTLKYKISTAYTGVADKTAKINVYFSKIKNGASFDGTNTELVQNSDFIYTANEGANLTHTVTLPKRVDISDMTEDDIVFIMIRRIGGDGNDDLTDSVDFSHVWCEYRIWQHGKNILI